MVLTEQDIWSFVMACGFLAATWLKGMLYLQADRRLYSIDTRTNSIKKRPINKINNR